MTTRKLTQGQAVVLGAAAVVMVAVGAAGGIGTFSNVVHEFHRAATAVGVVAAGEGLTLILALTMLGLTMLGQPSPTWVRGGLWGAPIAACLIGLSLANTVTEYAVYGMTPLAMSGAAEGLGLIARRIVTYTTGVDADAQRRQADAVQQLAYHQAAAERHPDKKVREDARRKSWTLAKEVGRGDQVLGAALVGVQRERITGGADAALGAMYGAPPAQQAAPPARSARAQDVIRARFAEMDPANVVRIVHETHPDAPPAELAELLLAYGVVVDAVQVAVLLDTRPAEYEVHRTGTPGAPQVTALPAVNLQGAVEEAASALGTDASPRDIATYLEARRRLVVDEPYIRNALSRAAKRTTPAPEGSTMEGGYA
ncbi:hypothetical protein [Streptomyces siamensis]|uniref:Conjugal transfer protein n=1 Tax=Streptomyces siamensis TaxID=1274986 RepID=A0ABP9JIT0_9ACTN